MKAFVLGGAGFLGFHTVNELLKKGYEVKVFSRSLAVSGLFPPEVEFVQGDLENVSDKKLLREMKGCTDTVFAGGLDDRVIPKKPAYPLFRRANVEQCTRYFRIAREAKISNGVFLGSYFCHFHRKWPRLRLAHHHPYVKSRIEQEDLVLQMSDDKLKINCLELPYIFGSMPGRTPLWAPLMNYIRSSWPLFYPEGGTNAVAVKHVAEAAVGALEKGEGAKAYLVGDKNLAWTKMIGKLAKMDGSKKEVKTVPNALLYMVTPGVNLRIKLQGKESGLNPFQFIKVQTRKTYFDPAPSRKALGFKSGGLDQAFRETIKACPKKK